MSIRVLLADDNVFVREGMRALLDAAVRIEVVGIDEDAPNVLTASGGEIWFDGVLVRKDGLFVLPELEGLNPENLV